MKVNDTRDSYEGERGHEGEKHLQVSWTEKVRFMPRLAHALPRDERKGRKRGQVLQARHYVYHTKRLRNALPIRKKPDVSCWELAGFTAATNYLAPLAFSFSRGVKRSGFENVVGRLRRIDPLFAEIQIVQCGLQRAHSFATL